MTTKRKRQDGQNNEEENENTSGTSRAGSVPLPERREDELNDAAHQVETPLKRRRGRPPGSKNKPKPVVSGKGSKKENASSVEKSRGKLLFATPTKSGGRQGENHEDDPSPLIRNPERSARRKSARTLIQRKIADDLSDESNLDDEDALARTIWDIDDVGEARGKEEEGVEDEEGEDGLMLSTPSKHGPRKHTNARRKRTPTPPPDLPHELYFFQNCAGNSKTSNNTFTQSLLTHEEYHHQISTYRDPHTSSHAFLHALHSRSFPQWTFELSQSFNICLYGYGSKRHLVTSFANYLHGLKSSPGSPKIVIINGYIPTLTIRQILTTVASLAFDSPLQNLGSQPREILQTILTRLSISRPPSPIRLFINSLDAPPLRRAPIPSLLAHLASSPYINILATCDSPSFPLLWDTALREQYNFLFHDATTFISYAAAEIGSVVDDVNELLGRSGRNVKGKEGIGFVLRSLPENARNLYRVLIAELLAGIDNNEEVGAEEDLSRKTGERMGRSREQGGGVGADGGIEYRVLYQKVVEEFICSSEMAFRTLLKEFHDHQMVVSRRDPAGTEMLTVPFRREEMEAILEDLMGVD
jgi:origin recognition complex subunit 2